MKFSVKVIPQASVEKVERIADNELKIWLKVKPVENEANFRLVDLLAEYFKVSKSQVHIKSGFTSRVKIVEIES